MARGDQGLLEERQLVRLQPRPRLRARPGLMRKSSSSRRVMTEGLAARTPPARRKLADQSIALKRRLWRAVGGTHTGRAHENYKRINRLNDLCDDTAVEMDDYDDAFARLPALAAADFVAHEAAMAPFFVQVAPPRERHYTNLPRGD